MKKEEYLIENTIGYKIAITFKPFIDPKCTEHIEIVKDIAKAINSNFRKQIEEYTNRIVENANTTWKHCNHASGNYCDCEDEVDKESITSQLPKFLNEIEL